MLFDSSIAFSPSCSLRRIAGIASAKRPCSVRTRGQKTRTVRISGAISLFGNCPALIGRRAVTWLPVPRANAVPMLGDFEPCPIVFAQGSDESGDHAGLAHVARVSADHDDGHGKFVVGRWSSAL